MENYIFIIIAPYKNVIDLYQAIYFYMQNDFLQLFLGLFIWSHPYLP